MGNAQDPDDVVYETSTSEPVAYGEPTHSVLTPEGEIESVAGFAQGLGPNRLKLALGVGAAVVLLLALLAAL